ncbi:L,D-transpeptidase family protein [Nonomuraea sp. NPDC050328]|uniref:L,D-transpeptidase family protein n=1 Tax=Nonomuraea sp. NPDC050328 TaxID=3364361 RepID=UPI00379C4462
MIDPQILQVEQRLAELHISPGRVDGVFTRETAVALWALQKLNGLRPVSKLTPATLRALQRPRKIHAPVRDGVVVDLSRQVLFLYERGKIRLISHVSTGANRYYCMKGRCGYAVTPLGDYRVFRRVHGWDRGPLGSMYKTMYFNHGIALHGSKTVPRWPASHGCVRLPMHVADRLFRQVEVGTMVRVRP